MATRSFKVSFALDEADARYFRSLFKRAKRAAADEDPDTILGAAQRLVKEMRESERIPHFVVDAVETLEDLIEVIGDEDWAAPKRVRSEVLGALAYFSNPEDLIPDHIPVLGFLDDAIMIKIIEGEFKHELAAYRKFRRFRLGAEQRPWTGIAKERLPRRLREQRDKLRLQADGKRKADAEKPSFLSFLG